jgi:excisionase family DNA binding protein
MENSVPRLEELPDLLTVAEVKQFLRIGKNAAYELLAAGRLRSIRVGRRRLVPKAAVARFLENQEENLRPHEREDRPAEPRLLYPDLRSAARR